MDTIIVQNYRRALCFLKYIPSSATNTVNVGKAMICCLDRKLDIVILNNKDINEIASTYR